MGALGIRCNGIIVAGRPNWAEHFSTLLIEALLSCRTMEVHSHVEIRRLCWSSQSIAIAHHHSY